MEERKKHEAGLERNATLLVVGTPLDEEAALSPSAIQRLQEADLYLGESRKQSFRYLKDVPGAREKPIFFLDHLGDRERLEIEAALRALHAKGGCAALFSDTGMPILFDPGAEILATARRLGYTVRSVAGPTSWGAACALSGLLPPFLLIGFLPRETEDRVRALGDLRDEKAHCVLMDTPYRFRLLLKQARESLGDARQAFLAWEISKKDERLLWGPLSQLEKTAAKLGMEKGEFILILEGRSRGKG